MDAFGIRRHAGTGRTECVWYEPVDSQDAVDVVDLVASTAQPVAYRLGASRTARRLGDVLVGRPPAFWNGSNEGSGSRKVNRRHAGIMASANGACRAHVPAGVIAQLASRQ